MVNLMTYGEIYRTMRRDFEEAEISSPALEARFLIEKAAGKSRERLVREMDLTPSAEIAACIEGFKIRRLKGEPAAYITGEWEFFSLPFYVTSHTLIPRQDTEVLVERAISLFDKNSSPKILDLCTGSGCIGIAVGKNLPRSQIVLADISQQAMAVAEKNIERNGMTSRCRTVIADVFEPPEIGDFDAVLSNPPYIPRGDLNSLDLSVQDYEPLSALDGGERGLDFYKAIAALWKKALKPSGHMVLECGIHQIEDVERIFAKEGFGDFHKIRDLSGIYRVLQCTKG